MKFTFQNHEISVSGIKELYDIDSSYFPIVDFVKRWERGENAFEVQTSGSTGIPKKITLYRKQIEASVGATTEFLDLRQGENILMCLRPNYIGGLMMAARGLILDMDVHIVQPSVDPLSDAKGQYIDFASFVPYQIYHLIEQNRLAELAQIRNVLIGGAPLTDQAFEKLAQLPNRNFMTYAMTETVSHIALMPIESDPKGARYNLLPNIFIGTNEKGCLWIEGDVTNNQRIQTTDVVEIENDVYFKWFGRNDFVINSGGVKIHPEQVEKIIAREFEKLGIKNDFYMVGLADEKLGHKVVLKVEGEIIDDRTNEVLGIINSVITSEKSKFHAPKEILAVKKFERTSSGKVKRI